MFKFKHRKIDVAVFLTFCTTINRVSELFIIEFIPSILVSDGHNFLEAIFTKEAINEFRKYYSHVRFSSLRDKIIYISKWKLEISRVDSKKYFNSY